MKIRVVIDAAAIGWAHRHKSYARGVHRVAERLIAGLLVRDECEIYLVATSSLFSTHRALKEKWPGLETKLRYSVFQFWLSRWSDRIFVWVERTLPDRRLHMRAGRWLLHHLALWADARAQSIPSALLDASIYHSPLAPIPRGVRGRGKIKCFLTVHDLIPLTRPETVGGKGALLLLRQLQSVEPDAFAFCVSQAVRSDLLQLTSLPADHVRVTPLAADPAVFHIVEEPMKVAAVCSRYGIPNCPYLLVISSFDPRKNFAHAIECFANLAGSGGLGDCNLVIVGSNPERTEAVSEALSRYPTLRPRVICPGFIPDKDIASIYSGALAFLFPSLAEGFGLPPLEAMQCGVPVICSSASAMPEVVGDAAILLPPKDVGAWCHALQSVWRDPALRADLSQRGLARSREFSWERFTAATLAGYQAALQSNGSPGARNEAV